MAKEKIRFIVYKALEPGVCMQYGDAPDIDTAIKVAQLLHQETGDRTHVREERTRTVWASNPLKRKAVTR